MADELIVNIDITDWRDEALHKEFFIDSEEAIVAALTDGKQTGDVARSVAVAREMNIAPEDILRPNKLLYYAGLMADISAIARRSRAEVEVESGTVYEIPNLIGTPGRPPGRDNGDDDGEEDNEPLKPSYVTIDDPESLGRAKKLLLEVVPGHIWHQLLVVYKNNADVLGIANELKTKIDELVGRILE